MLDDRKVLLNRVKVLFSLACFFFAIEMTITQIVRYLDNRDTSLVSYKTFNDSPLDRYPTFSICFQGQLYRFDGLLLGIGITTDQYLNILKGKTGVRYEYIHESGLFTEIPISFDNVSATPLKEFRLKVSDVIKSLEFKIQNTETETTIDYENRKKGSTFEEVHLGIGLHTPDTICFTRISHDKFGILRLADIITFKRSFVVNPEYGDVEMAIYVHYPGQLWRSLENPKFISKLRDMFQFKLYELRISSVVIERKRPDANDRCNDRIEDDDNYLLHKIVGRVGCVPPYWMHYFQNIKGFSECKTSEQMSKLSDNIRNYKSILYSYDPPCEGMAVLTIKNEDAHEDLLKTAVRFSYTDVFKYQEILHVQEFSFESFWSAVGGFIGIFLGYSLLQLPDLLNGVPSLMKNCIDYVKQIV